MTFRGEQAYLTFQRDLQEWVRSLGEFAWLTTDDLFYCEATFRKLGEVDLFISRQIEQHPDSLEVLFNSYVLDESSMVLAYCFLLPEYLRPPFLRTPERTA